MRSANPNEKQKRMVAVDFTVNASMYVSVNDKSDLENEEEIEAQVKEEIERLKVNGTTIENIEFGEIL